MDEPLIATSKGNLPLASLRENVVWTDDENDTTCALEYWLGDECVRREVHIYKRTGYSALGSQGAM